MPDARTSVPIIQVLGLVWYPPDIGMASISHNTGSENTRSIDQPKWFRVPTFVINIIANRFLVMDTRGLALLYNVIRLASFRYSIAISYALYRTTTRYSIHIGVWFTGSWNDGAIQFYSSLFYFYLIKFCKVFVLLELTYIYLYFFSHFSISWIIVFLPSCRNAFRANDE